MPPLSNGQQISLASVTLVSCSLSLMGSGVIVYLVLKRDNQSTYHRLLLCMSVTEILHSLETALQPFFIPVAEDRIFAVGNQRTCSALGFFAQFGITIVTLYSAMLNLNYLLTIRYGVKAKKLALYVEPWMHALASSYPLITASVGAGIGAYSANVLGSTCWIGEYPKGCVQDDNVPCKSTMIGWIFSGLPLLGSLIFLICSNISVYVRVRSTINKLNQNAAGDASRDQRKRDVATQATLYVVACFISIIWMIAVRTLESMGVGRDDEQDVFWLLLLTQIFFPAQGLWNMLIFIRPRYMKARRRTPEKSRWSALQQAFSSAPSRGPHRSSVNNAFSSGTESVEGGWPEWGITKLFKVRRRNSMTQHEEFVVEFKGRMRNNITPNEGIKVQEQCEPTVTLDMP